MKITYTFIMKVLPALLAALCWTSCSDFLEEDPKGQLPSDTYFSNKEDLDASLTALYSVIASSQDRKSTRLNSSHASKSRMPSSA